jgi:hypothetical protein
MRSATAPEARKTILEPTHAAGALAESSIATKKSVAAPDRIGGAAAPLVSGRFGRHQPGGRQRDEDSDDVPGASLEPAVARRAEQPSQDLHALGFARACANRDTVKDRRFV